MMPSVFWNSVWTAALVNHLWQSTVVVGIAWLLALALKKNQARTRYWVWMIASVKFLTPFSLFIAAGEWMRSLMTAPIAKPALAAAIGQITQPFQLNQPLGEAWPVVTAHRADV
jgi:beta-lactamase regulating signal transducer with metallopeptidase domain